MMMTDYQHGLHTWRALSPASQILCFALNSRTALVDVYSMCEKEVCMECDTQGKHTGERAMEEVITCGPNP